MKRILKVLTVASAIVFGSLVVIWPVSYHLNLSRGIGQSKLTPSDSMPVVSGYRLGFEEGGVWFYNYEMPYRGSIISSLATKTGCDLPGVYFRHISMPGYDPAETTLRVSLWYPILLFALLPALWIVRRRHLLFGSHEHDA